MDQQRTMRPTPTCKGMASPTPDYAQNKDKKAWWDAREEWLMDDDLDGLANDPHFQRATPIFLEQELLEDEASTLLFSGSHLTSLGATLLLLNLCHTHGTSNLSISNLFSILSSSTLPTINHLPKNNYQASKRLKQLGLDYEASMCVLTIACCSVKREYVI